MKLNKINIALMTFFCAFSINSNAADEKNIDQSEKITMSDTSKVASNNGADDIKKITERNEAVGSTDYLISYYKSTNNNGGRIETETGSFDLNQPISLYDVATLNHDYFRKNIKKIKEQGLEKYASSMNDDNYKKMRNDSIYNEALRVGIQSALYETIYDYNKTLENVSDDFSKIYNFDDLLLENGKVIPPSIVDVGSSVSKENIFTLRFDDGSFFINKQAEVTVGGLNYLKYVIFDAIKPKTPSVLLLPINNEEEKIWESGVEEGWVLGIRQASEIIREGFATLLRDFAGMNNYLLLYKANMISYPAIQRLDIGTNYNSNQLKIGEVTFKIAALPQFNNDTQNWKPLIRVNDFIDKLEKDINE